MWGSSPGVSGAGKTGGECCAKDRECLMAELALAFQIPFLVAGHCSKTAPLGGASGSCERCQPLPELPLLPLPTKHFTPGAGGKAEDPAGPPGYMTSHCCFLKSPCSAPLDPVPDSGTFLRAFMQGGPGSAVL